MSATIRLENDLQQVWKQAVPLNNSLRSQCSSSFIYGTEKDQLAGVDAVVFAQQDHQGRRIGVRIQRDSTEATSYILGKQVEYLIAIGSLNIARFRN